MNGLQSDINKYIHLQQMSNINKYEQPSFNSNKYVRKKKNSMASPYHSIIKSSNNKASYLSATNLNATNARNVINANKNWLVTNQRQAFMKAHRRLSTTTGMTIPDETDDGEYDMSSYTETVEDVNSADIEIDESIILTEMDDDGEQWNSIQS